MNIKKRYSDKANYNLDIILLTNSSYSRLKIQKNCQENKFFFFQENYTPIVIYVVRIFFRYVYLTHHSVDENK